MAIYIDDRELIAAHQAGDTEAFDELVREHRSSLHNHARRKLYCDSAAEDAVQETLVRAYRALPKFDGEYRLGPWLHRIMSNVCIDEANRRKRDGEKTDLLAAQPSSRSNTPGIEEQLGLQVDDSLLQTALDELPESHREALTLRFVEELDYQQVAQVSGVSEQNARARVSRARTAMRAAMKGVASLPVVLLGLMKRGEKAAAAATAGTTAASATASSVSSASAVLPTITEATMTVAAAAPAVVPVVAKAAVGIGLAAAVLTPTSDSAVHIAAEALVSASVVVEADEAELPAAQFVIQESITTDEQAVEAQSPAGSDSAVKIKIETTSPSQTKPIIIEGPSSSEEIVVEQPKAAITTGIQGNMATSNFVAERSAEGQYDLSGDVRFVVGGITFAGEIDPVSRIQVGESIDAAGHRRIEALIATSNQDGSSLAEIRLVGFVATEISGSSRISGLFRANSDETSLLSGGSFSGLLELGSQTKSGSLDLQFTQ